MTREVVLVASLLALMATSAQGKGGVFIVGGDVGSVHHIGGVAKGSRIVVNITAKQAGIDFTCPMKVTLVFLADNNRKGLQRRAFRRNALNSQVIVPSAPISGEAVLFLQNQNINHACNLTFDAAQEGTLGVLSLNVDSRRSSRAVPVTRGCEAGLAHQGRGRLVCRARGFDKRRRVDRGGPTQPLPPRRGSPAALRDVPLKPRSTNDRRNGVRPARCP